VAADELQQLKELLYPLKSERDYPEDFKYENGHYMCHCLDCHKSFLGHKRRIICKLCAVRVIGEVTSLKRK
jgi:hypothetical protein